MVGAKYGECGKCGECGEYGQCGKLWCAVTAGGVVLGVVTVRTAHLLHCWRCRLALLGGLLLGGLLQGWLLLGGLLLGGLLLGGLLLGGLLLGGLLLGGLLLGGLHGWLLGWLLGWRKLRRFEHEGHNRPHVTVVWVVAGQGRAQHIEPLGHPQAPLVRVVAPGTGRHGKRSWCGNARADTSRHGQVWPRWG